MPSNVALLRTARQIHLYLGVFIAPALLFFAFTGFVQTFSMHETTRGSTYQPPQILVRLGQLHKKQTLDVPVRKPQPPTGAPRSKDAAPPANLPIQAPPGLTPEQKKILPMKLFFALVAVGLFTSTLTGLYMAYKFCRNPKLITGLWLAGILIPVMFTLL